MLNGRTLSIMTLRLAAQSSPAAHIRLLRQYRGTAVIDNLRPGEWRLDPLLAKPLQDLDAYVVADPQSFRHVRQMEPQFEIQ